MSDILSLYKNELPGILNWAVGGWRKYKNDGLQPPEEVLSPPILIAAKWM